MQDKPAKKSPRTLRLNAKDNIIVAVDSVEPGVVGARRSGNGAHHARAQDGGPGHRQGAAGPQIRTDHRLCHRGHRARRARPHPQLLVRRVRARLRLRPGRARGDVAAGRGARHLRRLPPRQRQGRHAQLHRHAHQRELLGLRGALHGGGGDALRHPRAISQRRRRRLVRARHRLRAGRPRARATRRSSARNGATPAIPISPPPWSWAWAARCSRSSG